MQRACGWRHRRGLHGWCTESETETRPVGRRQVIQGLVGHRKDLILYLNGFQKMGGDMISFASRRGQSDCCVEKGSSRWEWSWKGKLAG